MTIFCGKCTKFKSEDEFMPYRPKSLYQTCIKCSEKRSKYKYCEKTDPCVAILPNKEALSKSIWCRSLTVRT